MNLVVYVSTDHDCPEGQNFVGHLFIGKKLQPLFFTGHSAADVRRKASEFFEIEQDKEARTARNKAKRVEMLRKPAIITEGN